MKPHQTITSLEQLKCIAHPLRNRILFLFTSAEPLSVQGIAHKLGLPHGKVYYHVRLLVENGFLEEVRNEPVNGIIERFYAPAATSFTTSKALAETPGVKQSLQQTADRMFEQLVERMRDDTRVMKDWAFDAIEAFLTEDDLQTVVQAIDRLFEPYRQPRPGAARVRVTSLFAHEPFADKTGLDPKKEDDQIE